MQGGSDMSGSANDQVTYPPLDVLKLVADGVWIVDSGPLRVLGTPIPIRMTVVRLRNGDLWLHSPTRNTEALTRELEQQGSVRHLVAPDVAHWSFVKDWQRHYPDAVTWAAPGLRDRSQVRKAGLRIDHDLGEMAPADWADEIEQVLVPGLGFSEVDFLHIATRTLMLTDLVQNFEPQKLPMVMRLMTRLIGVLGPEGGTPLYLRVAVRAKRKQAAHAASRMVDWNPERVIFSHGRWFDRNGAAALRRALGWLLPG